jgi:aspartyl-tRNA synthetase
MKFAESMRRFGNDKPDLRFGMEHTDLTELVIDHNGGGIPPLQEIAERFARGDDRRDLPHHIVKAMVVASDAGPEKKGLSRTEADKLEEFVKSMGAKGLARAKVAEDGNWTQLPGMMKGVTAEFRKAVNEATKAKTGDLILFQFGREAQVQTVMANLRLHVAKKLGMIPDYGTSNDQYEFLWVIDPPLFEFDPDAKRWVAAHHAFTRPHDACVDLLEKDPGKVLCYRYDIVLNGFEIGGGSIRLHDPSVQARVFTALGIHTEEARTKFGFLLDALKFGAPPHGGIAIGMDRFVMLLSGAESLRDVVAYPKTQKGTDLMMGAPGSVSPEQLAELKVATIKAE